ncbi:hypothetical protein [Calothrix sp. PCC 6303]|uniref:hypothetical protein n=1 Tax=Calothrix sp. PCC 6303 TaxID=1170562 RepID=UPI0002A0024D|nr:hypothetical protein [Calothrix sp. PCC 6303]AFZ03042.1 hypothetical protein Cal6303_4128 [Calothrix sp. PCC 6303]
MIKDLSCWSDNAIAFLNQPLLMRDRIPKQTTQNKALKTKRDRTPKQTTQNKALKTKRDRHPKQTPQN